MIEINTEELQNKYWTTFWSENIDDLIEMSKKIGDIIPSRKNSTALYDSLTVKTKEETNQKSLSAKYGEKDFPYHTDGAYLHTPPKFVILRSPKSIENCPTKLCIPHFSEIEIKKMMKDVLLVNGGRGRFYSTLIEKINKDFRIRFDVDCMRPALNEFDTSIKLMNTLIKEAVIEEINWEENQCIIFNNWKLVHSRANATNKFDRVLERIWIK
ncbi:Taurine catabolism dioxygenase TauD, TfdA family [Chryseobacterium carnipullorum]|uniref:TauD/TfdA family dioxygenase n=1 Tax=Chryseobacterium carnipullorum TaxID=1124835 RepID=UPI000920060C|nr:TauD/TfdA family dioxygenase [Chryseobacterium carnipullorum]SHN07613.1 Taurine catabolism dioxygenase TauD, TfdA family [Chryseobacterium carnipullorum]